MTVCAIIPTYNRASMLKQCIDSILAQTYPLSQIIVVNDGSTDDTIQVVTQYGDKVTLINKENGGKSSALNAALPLCTSDYVWICDDDDVASPDGLSYLVSALDNLPNIGYAFGTYKIFNDNISPRQYESPQYWARSNEPNYKICFLEGMFTYQFSTLYRYAVFHDIGLFREDLIRSQDYDMANRIARHHAGYYMPHIIFYQRQHGKIRGSQHNRFANILSEQKWLEYDQIFFIDTINTYDILEFCPSFAKNWDTRQKLRACYIQKACIFANRGLWAIALSNIKMALANNHSPLTDEEANLPRLSITKYLVPWTELEKMPNIIQSLKALSKDSDDGQKLIESFSAPILWNIRLSIKNMDFGTAGRLVQILKDISSLSDAVKKILRSVS